MALTASTDDRLIICNGFKERRYIRRIVCRDEFGRRVVAVIENLDELELILSESAATNVRPHIGIRLKLDSPSGRWRDSTGKKAKFGLTIRGVDGCAAARQTPGMLELLRAAPLPHRITDQ